MLYRVLCFNLRSLALWLCGRSWSKHATGLAMTLAALVATSAPSAAQLFWFNQEPPRAYRRPPAEAAPRKPKRVEQVSRKMTERAETPERAERVQKPLKAEPAAKVEPDRTNKPLFAIVSIGDQTVSVYGADGEILHSKVSTGTESNPTPTGVFAIIQKNRWHESNLYSGAPMPFMQRITWSGVAMHQGVLPGYPASHGCIRLPQAFAEQWFGMTKLGLRVIVSPEGTEPVPIMHAMLPVPRYFSGGGETMAQARPIQSAALSRDILVSLADPATAARERLLDPVAYAVFEKARSKSRLKAAQQAEGVAEEAAKTAARTADEALTQLRSAEKRLNAARDRLAWFGYIGNRPPPRPGSDYGEGLMVAIETFEQANRAVLDLARAEGEARAQSLTKAAIARDADQETSRLEERIVEMGRRAETVSVFISRKDQRLYVRQALRPVFDAPISIKDMERPLGTHVFIGAQPLPGDTALRWSAVSLPAENQDPARPPARRGRAIETASISPPVAAETAAGALDRIELPGEILDSISELVWAGSSLIISDHGITHETGAGTDFIIQTRH
jgi:lipoprotein-anchoring transpeptidase ErfK/SrfK